MNDDKDKKLNDVLSEGSNSAERDSLNLALGELRQSKNEQTELLLTDIFLEDNDFERDSLNQSLNFLKIQRAEKIHKRFILLATAAAILVISFLMITLINRTVPEADPVHVTGEPSWVIQLSELEMPEIIYDKGIEHLYIKSQVKLKPEEMRKTRIQDLKSLFAVFSKP